MKAFKAKTCLTLRDNDIANPGHSGRGSATLNAPIGHPFSLYNEMTQLNNRANLLSIDDEGRLWTGGNNVAPTIAQDSTQLEFTQIVMALNWMQVGTSTYQVSGSASGIAHPVLLLARPRTATSTTTIAQIPQSGDPAASTRQMMTMLAAIGCIGMAAAAAYIRRKSNSQI